MFGCKVQATKLSLYHTVWRTAIRIRLPEGNGCAERFIRTLKENLLWVETFETVEQLRLAVLKFKKTYNEQWIIQKFGYQTPSQARKDACKNPQKAA
jgi:transposase InsO family protein